jgi:hypothetical protein
MVSGSAGCGSARTSAQRSGRCFDSPRSTS